MTSLETACRTAARSCHELLQRGFLALAFASVALLGVNAAFAQAAPVIDGNITDLIQYGQTLEQSDQGCGIAIVDNPNAGGAPVPELIYNDFKYIPCPLPVPPLGTHWVNGIEIFKHYLVYAHGSSTLYLGLTSEGFIGDVDGDNDPDAKGGVGCNPADNIDDTPGISGNDLYQWVFDLNCDGVNDASIKIVDNAVVGTGLFAGVSGSLAFRQNAGTGATGHDLEVQVNLLAPLPPAFNYVRVESNAFDGLSEDRSDGQVCIATPKIDVVKSAEPVNVCVGAKTRFTLSIQNTGQTPLSVVAVDNLPAVLTYAGNLSSSCGVGAPQVNGTVLTFPAFDLAAGATCTVSFDATAGPDCFGEVTNHVDVTGTFTSACIKEGGAVSVTDSADFTVLCKAPPCVEVTASGPEAACPGAPVTISGTAKNCSKDPETIVVKVNGAQAYNQVVPAGQTIEWSLPTTMPEQCVAGQNTPFSVEATGTNDCGNDVKTTSVNVRCKDKPCLELTSGRAPESACPGDPITISGTVKNCSLDPETIVVKVSDVQVFNLVVAPGETKDWTTTVAMPQCTAGNSVTFGVTATATGDCPPAVTKTGDVSVLCKSPPCVSVTAEANKSAACPNEEVIVSGKVKNCGTDPADFVVTVGGVQAFSGTLAAGAEADYSRTVTMGDCVAGNNVSWDILATGHNACGDARDKKSVSVRCKDKPCLELTADVNPKSACPGDALVISGTVKNCSLDPETIVVTINGEQVINEVFAPGQTKDYSKNTTMPQCTAGNAVPFTVVANATGDCPPAAQKTVELSVQCKSPPCVSVTAEANKSAACPNEEVIVSGKVKNCGTDPANYTVTVGGVQVYSGSLAAGAEADYSRTVTMGDCVAGNNVTWDVVAHASNSCGEASDTKSVSVRCKDKPCLELTADVNPKSACPGDALVISGTVKNCSLDPETIVVTINGEQVINEVFAPGQTKDYSKNTTMPQCTAGNAVPFTVVANATGDCPPAAQKTVELSVQCKSPPCVSVTAEANKSAACPNEEVIVSGKVKNCGTDPADFVVTVGGVQAFSGTLAAGAEADYSRTVTMGDCVAGNNVSWDILATGHNACGDARDKKSVSVRCKDKPCVELTGDVNPKSACPGDALVISGTVKNCSLDPETIVVTINGEQVINEVFAPGQTKDYSKNTTMPQCTAGNAVPFTVVANATGDCPPAAQKTVELSVQCKSPPCVSVTAEANKSAACPNEEVIVSGKVKNCGTDPANYTVTVGGVQVYSGSLAAGAEADYSRTVTMGDCVAGNNVTWDVVAHASNSCGEASDTKSVSVRCKDKPCVELTGDVNPKSACPGTDLLISGTVKNCSIDPETIVVTINGEQVLNQVVAAGATAQYSKSTRMPACKSGEVVPFTVLAKATNDCDQNGVTKTAELSVTCKNAPCVEATAECNPPKACPGTPITVTGSAKNCSPAAEDIVISIEGQTQSFPAVPAGQTVSWQRTIVLRECTSGEAVEYKVTASATNDCGESGPVNASCSVICQKPQVEVSKAVSPSGSVAQGTTLHYTITVSNPSKDVALENVKVTDTMCDMTTYANNANPAPSSAPAVGAIGDVVWDVAAIPAGGSATFSFDVTVKTLEHPDCESDNLSCTNSVVVVGNCVDAQARATDSVTTPIEPCEVPRLCRLTGGGCLNEDGDNKGHKQSTFGGNASPEHSGGGPTGNSWEHVYRDGKTILFNWHSWDAHVIACSVVPPGPCSPKAINTRADFVGTGKYSIGPGGREQDGNMVAYIIDHNEGSCNKGTRDEYSIIVRTGLTIGEGTIVYQTSGYTDCGNLQIHETPASLFGGGTPSGQVEDPGTSLINRAFPNPFSGSTNFAYRVEADSRVEIGVYNVAGRLVKTLASGSQPVGTYVVTWDGADDGGVRMAPGVYFLKSQVGAGSSVSRLIYVAR